MVDALTESLARLYDGEIERYSLLSFEEEQELGQAIKDGDPWEARDAREKLVCANLRLVKVLARNYMGRGLDYDDLVQEGNMGLLTAADRFDYTLGWRFSTYAVYWIKQAISKAVSESGTIRVPQYVLQEYRDVAARAQDIEQGLGRRARFAEVAEATGKTEARVRWLYQVTRPAHRLDVALEEDEQPTMADLIADESAQVDEQVDRYLLADRVREALEGLSLRDRQAVELRFGLADGHNRTLAEVGEHMGRGVTAQRVDQVLQEVLARLGQDVGLRQEYEAREGE